MSSVPHLLTPVEAAELLSVTPHTVMNYCSRGRLRGIKQGRFWIAVEQPSVVEFIQERAANLARVQLKPQSKIDPGTEKPCKRCNQVRPIGDYIADPRYRDGYQPWCKACYAEYRRSPKQKALKHEGYKERYADPEYRASYRQRQNEYQRAQWHNNATLRQRKNAQNAISKSRPHRRQLIRDNGRVIAHRRRERMRAVTERHLTRAEWIRIRDHYGPACLCCGAIDPLTIDHVMPIAMKGPNDAPNIQPLCWGCNHKKRATYHDYRPDKGAWILEWW